MDTTWIKAQAEKLKEAATQHANDLSKSALDIVQDVANINAGIPTKDLEFVDGPLGFRMEGVEVSLVEDSGQAASNGLQVGDRLVAVAGEPLPIVEEDDEEGQKKLRKLVKRWIKETPRPVLLTFLPLEEAQLARAASPTEGAAEAAHQDSDAACAGGSSTVVAAAAQLAQLEEQAVARSEAYEREASRAAEEVVLAEAQLAAAAGTQADCEDVAESGSNTALSVTAELEAARACLKAEQRQSALHRQRAEELQTALNALVGEQKETLVAAGHAELERLEAQLWELQSASSQQCSEVQDLQERLARAEQASAAAELRAGTLAKELDGVLSAHAAELAVLHEEKEEQERRHAAAVAKVEERLASEAVAANQRLEQSREELRRAEEAVAAEQAKAEAAAVDAQAAAIEAAASRLEAAEAMDAAKEELARAACSSLLSASVPDAVGNADPADNGLPPLSALPPRSGVSKEEDALYERIDVLEQRCRSLQQRLSSRPRVQETPSWALPGQGGLQIPPSWGPWLATAAGQQTASIAVLLYTVAAVPVDFALRAFTQRLLKRSSLLWMFYAQLVVLYAIAASCYAQTSAQPDVGTDLLQGTGIAAQVSEVQAGGGLRGSAGSTG